MTAIQEEIAWHKEQIQDLNSNIDKCLSLILKTETYIGTIENQVKLLMQHEISILVLNQVIIRLEQLEKELIAEKVAIVNDFSKRLLEKHGLLDVDYDNLFTYQQFIVDNINQLKAELTNEPKP